MVNLTFQYPANSSSSGVMSDVFGTNQVTGALDWSSFASVWSEARVRGIRVEYVPFYNGTYNTSLYHSTGAACDRHVPVSTLSSLGDALTVPNWKAIRSSAGWVKEWRARGVEESAFESTAGSLINHGGVQCYMGDLTASESYGNYYITFAVEFRGRQ